MRNLMRRLTQLLTKTYPRSTESVWVGRDELQPALATKLLGRTPAENEMVIRAGEEFYLITVTELGVK